MSLRERKRARTRQAIVDAAVDLFERHGYERTTIADIAAAAEIGTRTFFGYFPTKEDLLFPETDARVQAAIDAIATRTPGESPADVLLRGLRAASAASDDMTGRLGRLRTRLMLEVPAVRGRALQLQLEGQREISHHLVRAFPDTLDPVSAAALTGALVGAVSSALLFLFEDPDRHDDPATVRAALQHAADVALRPWSRPLPPPFDAVFLRTAPVVTAPDGSAVRPLGSIEGVGSFAHFQLDPGQVARPIAHATVHEIWFVVAGSGQMWRRQGDREETIDLRAGECLTIPLGTAFQFRAGGDEPLEVVAATMPPWPADGDAEARPVPGPWEPSL